MIHISQFDYQLPKEAIAQTPVSPRDRSKLMVIDRKKKTLNHYRFFDLPHILNHLGHNKKPILVRNNTKVMPARLYGTKNSGGRVEILLLKQTHISQDQTEDWLCLTKPGIKPGQTISFDQSNLQADCIEISNYHRLIRFNKSGTDLYQAFEDIGHMPIPPYINWNQRDEKKLRELYQTTYAKVIGSAAAPTAGLHFTKKLDQEIKALGIQIEEVTLHVGLGTFLPVKTENITQHQLHSEWFSLSEETANRLNTAKKAGQPIIAVGTTTTRVLESAVNPKTGLLSPTERETQIFIYPPYIFAFIDGLITNFHLPQSSLLMLISALVSEPNTNTPFTDFASSLVGKAYAEALKNEYRFFSFGDAMFIH